MLATLLANPARIAGRDLLTEPKLDGQRAQLHVRRGRTAPLYSCPGRELLGHAGFAWLRDLRWPVDGVRVPRGDACELRVGARADLRVTARSGHT